VNSSLLYSFWIIFNIVQRWSSPYCLHPTQAGALVPRVWNWILAEKIRARAADILPATTST
jgi:hypothetical protein